MDDRRFDQIARLCAGGLSRRQTIKAVLGGLVAAGVGSGRHRRAAAAELGCCRCLGAEGASTDCQSVQTLADCNAVCGQRPAIHDPYAQCVNGACRPMTTGDFGCCVCLGDRKKVCANKRDLAACKEYCKQNADDAPADADISFNPNSSCQPGEKKGVYHCMRKSAAAPASAIACRIADFGAGTSTMLAVVGEEGLLHSGGTVFLTEQAFARVGETAASVAPMIFGDAAAAQVRFDSFFAADGTHNLYTYQIAPQDSAGAAALVNGLAAQFARSDAEDVSKKLNGWDENIASRFAFATDQGNFSRIQSFNAVDDYVVWIVDDRFGDRKNTVTLHRQLLDELPKVRPWYNPSTAPDATQATPPDLRLAGLSLAGLMPLAKGVEQFSWVQTARDGDVVPRYNVDSDETLRTLGGAINAFNGAYPVQRNGVAATVYASFREFARPEAAAEFASNYEQIFAESDGQNGLRRVRDEAFQVCLPASSPRGGRAMTVTPEDCEPLSVSQIFSFVTVYGYLFAWSPVENLRLMGWALVAYVDALAMDLAWFFQYEGEAETFDSTDPADLEGYGEGQDAVLELITDVFAPWDRYLSPPSAVCFVEVTAPESEDGESAANQEEESPVETGPTGFVNIAGANLYPLDYGQLLGQAVRRFIVKGTYYDLDAGEDPLDTRGLGQLLNQAGLEDVACLRVGDLNEAGELIDASTSAIGWSLNPGKAFDAYEQTRDFLSSFAERPLDVPAGFATTPYSGFIINGTTIGPSFPSQAAVAVAQTGTVVIGFAVEGDNAELVERGIRLIYDRLLDDEVPGDFLSRKIVLPEGEGWSPKVDFTYTCLEGVVQFPLGLADDEAALFARRNEGPRNVFQARSEYATGRNDAAAGIDIVIRGYYDADAARAYFENYQQDFEEDFGSGLTLIDAGDPIAGSDQSRVFLSSRENADGVGDDALLMVARTGLYVPILRFGLKTLSSADDTRQAFLRETDGSLKEGGKVYMTEQIRVLTDDESGVFRAKPIYSFL